MSGGVLVAPSQSRLCGWQGSSSARQQSWRTRRTSDALHTRKLLRVSLTTLCRLVPAPARAAGAELNTLLWVLLKQGRAPAHGAKAKK